MNILRVFASAFVRRLAIAAALVFLAWLGVGRAHAQAMDKPAAYAAAQAWLNSNFPVAGVAPDKQVKCLKDVYGGSPGVGSYHARIMPSSSGCDDLASHYKYAEFGYRSNSCSARPSLSNVSFQGAKFCSAGCEYEPDDVAPENKNSVDFSFFGMPTSIRHVKRLRPTGGVCESLPNPSDPQPDICVQQGTLTQCVTPDGKHCAMSSTGKKFCFEPKEYGTKTSGNEAMTKSPADKPLNLPPVPPKNGGDWEKKGEGTVSTTINNVTDNSKVTNNLSSYGDKGSGASGGGAQGESNAGSGDGGDKGDGKGDKDYGSVGGGGTCKEAFSCTGGDPVLCAIAKQQFAARCEAENRFGSGDGAGDFPGEGEGEGDPKPEDYNKTVTVGLSMIDQGGLGLPTSCPRFEVMQTSWGDFSFDDQSWCEILSVARTCLLFLGAFIALGILMGWGGKD